jgi:hypothetical protein
MKSILFLLLGVLWLSSVAAQIPKYTASVFYFSTDSAHHQVYSDKLMTGLESILLKTNRFGLTERHKIENPQTAFPANEIVPVSEEAFRKSQAMGIQYLVVGHLSNASSSVHKTKKGDIHYRGEVSYTLKIVEVNSKKLIATEIIHTSSGGHVLNSLDGTHFNSASDAIHAALERSLKKANRFFNTYLPDFYYVVSIDRKTARGSALDISVSAGSVHDVKKGTLFYIKYITPIDLPDGRKIYKEEQIGLARVMEVQGTEVCVCEIISGGRSIADAFDQNPRNLRAYRRTNGLMRK